MVSESELLELIRKGESECLELKEKFDKEAIKASVALANKSGGIIVIGVNDNKEIKGVRIGRETLKKWVNEISQATEPALIPRIEIFEVNDKRIVGIIVKESTIKPVAHKGICYLRVKNSNKKLTPMEVAEFHLQTIGSSWDAYTARGAKLNDIDTGKVKEYIMLANHIGRKKIREKPMAVLKKLDLIKGEKPTWAAILLFSKNPQRFVFQARVHCGRFKNETTIIDDEMIEGTVIEQVDDALEFVKKHLKLEFKITGKARREETWEYPLEAVREAIINAVCHRDYAEPSDVQIRIYDNELIVWSPGGLPLGLALEDLYKPHKSVLRNKLLAQVFFDIGFIENWGTGIHRMITACIKQNLPEPKFEEVQGFRVTFRKPLAIDELAKSGLNERQLRAVEYIEGRGSISNKEYQELNNITKRTATRDLAELVKMSVFRRVGKSKRELKYVLVSGQNVPKMSQKMSQKGD